MDTLLVERHDGIVSVVLNRPDKRNAINTRMWSELLEVFEEVAESTEDRVLVLSGAGGAFCSGADLSDPEAGGLHQLVRMRRIGNVAMALHQIPKPTIAKVNGVAAGAGLNMALGCDLVVASQDARFSEIFSRRGLSIDFGGSWLLPRLVGMHRSKELAFFADIITAAEAAEMGLVNRVLPAGEIDAFVDEWAGRLAAGPPLALSMTKTLLNAAFSSSLDEALESEGRCQAVNFGTADTAEAMRAFMEKREPRFEGR